MSRTSASLNGQFVSTLAFFNSFRPSGPNPFAALIPGILQVSCRSAQGRTPRATQGGGHSELSWISHGFGFPWPSTAWMRSFQWQLVATPYISTWAKRNHFEMLSSHKYPHSADDSTDLHRRWNADSQLPRLERSNSVNDQRHRWVTSAVFQSERKIW
jgi:hypothetical protein